MNKRKIIIAYVISFATFALAQTAYLPGYFINKNKNKVECFIKNSDKRFAPKSIEYKLSLDGSALKASTDSLEQIEIIGLSKFQRVNIRIDVSKERNAESSRNKEPEFEERDLLLKVLIEGDVNLYSFEDGRLLGFFIQKNNNNIEQLIYKEYIDNKRILRKNQLYKSQLSTYFSSSSVKNSDIINANYNQKDLMAIVEQHNQHSAINYVVYEKLKQGIASISLKAGMNVISAGIYDASYNEYLTDFGTKLNFRAGFEIEYLLPYNNYKWALVSDPAFSIYQAQNEENVSFISNGIVKSAIKYNAVELPLGIRYYHKFNDASRLYATASYVINFSSNSTLEYSRSNDVLLKEISIRPRWNMYFAMGYKFNDKMGVEMRIYNNQLIIYRYSTWDIKYNVASLQLSYRIM